ncbi:MAG: DPP IV N-terminal domain-containing protein [Caldilineaceae bacterium]
MESAKRRHCLSGGDTLYRYSLDDDTPQPLFRHADLTAPYVAWSPDGNWVAVVTTQQGEVDPKTNYPALTQTIWLVSPIREEARELATVPALPMQAANAELAWSADSQHLKLRNYVLDLNGNQLDLGAIIRANGIDWLPTTPQLLVNRAEGLQLVDTDGKLVRALSTQPAEVWTFTRDGQRLAYVLDNMAQNEREVIVFDLQSQSESFRTTLAGDFSTLSLLRWNPTGDLLYLDDWGYNSPIWALPVASTNESAVAEPAVVVEDGLLVEVLAKAGIDQPIPADAATLAGRELDRWSSASPDGAWVVEGLTAFPKGNDNIYYFEMRVKKADGSVEWMAVAEWSRFGLGYTTPQPLQWSSDGRYLYFTNAPVPDGCGLFVNASDLQRLDLADGTVREVLPFGTTWTLAIAPDAEKAVYSQQGKLYLLDLATANYASLTVAGLEADAQFGNFVWSPDSQRVAFTIAYHACMEPEWSHSLLLLDIHTLTITTVLEKDPRRLTIREWVDGDHLALSDYDGNRWLLDLTTGDTEEVTERSGLTQPAARPTPTIITDEQEASPPFAFPQDQTIPSPGAVRIFNTAALEGELALVNNCMAMLNLANEPVMVIWPPEYALHASDVGIRLLDQRTGAVLAHLGDKIVIGGGYDSVATGQRMAGESLPEACTPPFTGGHGFFVAAPRIQVREPVKQTRLAPKALETVESSQSPNGAWTAEIHTNVQDRNAAKWFYVELQVTSRDGQTVLTQIAEERANGMGYVMPTLLSWAPHGQALYYTEVAHPDGCALFSGGVGLWRLDLPSGKVTQVLIDAGNPTLSPDGRAIAYTWGAKWNELLLLDLQTDKTRALLVTMLELGAQWGNLVWSPDSQQVAFTIAYHPCLLPEWSQSIVVADVRTRTVKTLIEKDKRLFVAQAWVDADRIRVSDRDRKEWEVDVATGSLATGTDGLLQIERPQIKMPAQPAEAEMAAAITQIRAFANDLKLQVNFAGVSASSYAPVATYLFTTTGELYEINANTNEIVDFGPRSLGPGETPLTYDLTPRYTPAELEAMARTLIATHSPTIDLTQLTPQHGNKEQTTFFFRWEDRAHRVEWMHPFVQVGLTRGGDLVSYTNTLSLFKPPTNEPGSEARAPRPWVVFGGAGDGKANLYAMSPRGGEMYTVAENAITPFCAPDGTAIAFTRRIADKSQLFVIQADGTAERQLTTEGENFDATWSPDGRQLAFVGIRNGRQEIYTMQRDGSAQTQVTTNTLDEFGLAWSPTADQIAFFGRHPSEAIGALYLFDRQTKVLTDLTAVMHIIGQQPAWSPDGSRIAFYAFPDDENDAELYTVKPDGTDLHKLTDNIHADFANLANEYEPRWSPDGTQITFYADHDGDFQVYLMNTDGSNMRRLTNGEFTASNPCWLP